MPAAPPQAEFNYSKKKKKKKEIKSEVVELVINPMITQWDSLYFIEMNPILKFHQSIRFK